MMLMENTSNMTVIANLGEMMFLISTTILVVAQEARPIAVDSVDLKNFHHAQVRHNPTSFIPYLQFRSPSKPNGTRKKECYLNEKKTF